MIVGQHGEAALGVMTSALLSLAAQFAPAGPSSARFYILDGTPDDAPWAGALGEVGDILPHEVVRVDRHGVKAVLGDLAREVERRLEAPVNSGPEVFLLLCNLGRFRELRRTDEFDLGAARDSSVPSAALETILREGPTLGIYVLAWCDGLNSLNRVFNRAAQHEFGAKVVFQVASSDSIQLLDTPVAGRLGPHRALFLDEEQGVLEKFRPYSVPPREWLAWVDGRFRERRGFSEPGHFSAIPYTI